MPVRSVRSPFRVALAVALAAAPLLALTPSAAQETTIAIPGVEWLAQPEGGRYDIVLSGVSDGALPERVLANVRDERSYLEWSFVDGATRLESVLGDSRRLLGEEALPEDYAGRMLILQWDCDRVSVFCGHERLIDGWEHALVSGPAGYSGDIGGADLWTQPVESVSFADNFGRPAIDSLGDWVIGHGLWYNVLTNNQMTQDEAVAHMAESTNPLVFGGRSEDEAPGVITSGYHFWTDYWVDAAMRSEGASALGLVAFSTPASDGQAPKDYLAARWTSQLDRSETGDRLQLLAVRDGEPQVLAEAPGGFKPDQWYRLRLDAGAERVAVFIDGDLTLSTLNTSGLGRGCIGLLTEGSGEARFDDVRAGELDPGVFDFPDDADAWRRTPNVAEADDGWSLTTVGGDGLLFHPTPRIDADVTATFASAGASGEILIGYRDEGANWGLSWRAGETDNLRLVRRLEGEETVLATGSCPIRSGDRTEVRVYAVDEFFRVTVGGAAVMETVDPLRLDGGPLAGSDDGERPERRIGGIGIRLGDELPPRLSAVELREPVLARPSVIADRFIEDAHATGTYKDWALPSGAWINPAAVDYAGGVWWNKGDFYGDTELRATFAGAGSSVLAASDWSADGGYRFVVAPAETGVSVSLLRLGETVAEAVAEGLSLPQRIEFRKRGALLTATVGASVPLQWTDPEPLTGTRLGLLDNGQSIDLSQAYAFSQQEVDYTFADAPTDWAEQTGTWELSSRWTCTEDWSFWSGRSAETALMWSKPEFGPDVTVEAYVAMKMGMVETNQRLSYEHPHDANVTICGDGESVGSGYTFRIGGGDLPVTQLWKGDELLAETSAAWAMFPSLSNSMPDMNQFHRKWWQVRAEKRGGRLRLYFDDRLALEAVDPDPLGAGHVGVWTWDNGVMISRAKVYGARTGNVLKPRVTDARALAALQSPGRDLPPVTSTTHSALIEDFEQGVGVFSSYRHTELQGPAAERNGGSEQAATVVLEPEGAADGSRCVRMVNENPGGNFGVYAILRDFSPGSYGILGFDYKVDPSVRVDVVLKTAARDYVVRFTGEGSPPLGCTYLGAIQGVVADGKWRAATFDLRGALIDIGADPAAELVSEVLIGAFSYDRLLSTGVTGNPRGAGYSIDNFGVYSPGPTNAEFQWDPAPGATRYRCMTSRNPLDVPDASAYTVTEPNLRVQGVPGGVWYLHIAAVNSGGEPVATHHHRFVVADERPCIAETTPDHRQSIAGGDVALKLGGVESGIVPEALRITVAGKQIDLSSPGVRLDAANRVLHVNLDRYAEPEESNSVIDVRLTDGRTRAGTPLAGAGVAFQVRKDLDASPPSAPRIVQSGALLRLDSFEEEDDLKAWQPQVGSHPGDGAATTRDLSTAASGGASLRITKPGVLGRFGVWAVSEPFDAGRHRLLSFDYKIEPWLRIDMLLKTSDGGSYLLKMTDNDSYGETVIGSVPIVADGEWHRAEVDLYSMISRAAPQLGSYVVTRLGFAGGGWDGNPKGTSWNIDNFALASTAGAENGKVVLRWHSEDSSPIVGASYVVDDLPDTEPDTVADTTESHLTLEDPAAQGLKWVHVRTVDSRGNWSAASHQRVLIDAGGVSVASCSVQDGSSLCTDRFALQLADGGAEGASAGVDPTSIRLHVGGQDYAVNGRELVFNAANGRLDWNGQRADGQPRTFEDKQVVSIELRSAVDYAGNPLTSPFATSFIMDFAKDNAPPARPVLVSKSHPTPLFEPFETSAGGAKAETGAEVALDAEAVKRGGEGDLASRLGNGCLSVKRIDGEAFHVRLFQGDVDLSESSALAFAYCCPPETKMSLWLTFQGGESAPVVFSEENVQATRRIPGVIADGTWRRASLNLMEVARDLLGDRRGPRLRAVDLVDYDRVDTPVGSGLWLDNLWLTSAGQAPVVFDWRTNDPTGIVGYSWLIDSQPFTIPEERVTNLETHAEIASPEPERAYYIHVRALDGAGNWSDAAHLGVYQQ